MIIFLEDGIQDLKKTKDTKVANANKIDVDNIINNINNNKLKDLNKELKYDRLNNQDKLKMLIKDLSTNPNIEDVASTFAKYLIRIKDPFRSGLYNLIINTKSKFSYKMADLLSQLMIAQDISLEDAMNMGLDNQSLVNASADNPDRMKILVYAWKQNKRGDKNYDLNLFRSKSKGPYTLDHMKREFSKLQSRRSDYLEDQDYINLYKMIFDDHSDIKAKNYISKTETDEMKEDFLDELKQKLSLSDKNYLYAKRDILKIDKNFVNKAKEVNWNLDKFIDKLEQELDKVKIKQSKKINSDKTSEEIKDDSEV